MKRIASLTLLAAVVLSSTTFAQIETSVVTITKNGPPPNSGDVIEFFLTAGMHPCPPVSTNCITDDYCGSGIIFCNDLTESDLALLIAVGLSTTCPLPGVSVTAVGNQITIVNDKAVSGVDVFCCINMSECPDPFGYGLADGCPVNNVCSGACGDEDAAPGSTGYNFTKGDASCGTVYCDTNSRNCADIAIDGCTCATGSILVCMSNVCVADGNFTYLLIGDTNGVVTDPPGANGDLCVTGGCIGRYILDAGVILGGGYCTDILNANTGGGGGNVPNCGGNICNPPGLTWNFQYWHRDAMNPSRFSKAITATFN